MAIMGEIMLSIGTFDAEIITGKFVPFSNVIDIYCYGVM